MYREIETAAGERPRYARMRAIFLRALGLVYLSAFLSLAVQVDGLIGSRGILPAAEFLGRAKAVLGPAGFARFPTLLWWDASDAAIRRLCWGGVALSVLLAVGILPKLCLALLWVGYLSLTVAGQVFLSFQWDLLLLESGLLAVFLAPGGVWLRGGGREPPRLSVWLFHWLVFRLMFLSGVVKLTSRDPAWRLWQALRYHYETQPLPTWTSWYMHRLPAWFQSLSVGFMFWCELVAPFLVFAPRRLRLVGCFSFLVLQALIAATGNYGFFNLLAAALCLTLIEDREWGRKRVPPAPAVAGPGALRILRAAPLAAFAAVAVAVTTMEGLDRSGLVSVTWPRPLADLREAVAPLRSFNSYGLFAAMTTERPEITVEGSDDGRTWRPYRFRYKPGEPGRAPAFTTPQMPRLDWQMWFAALGGSCRGEPWFLRFEGRLLGGSPDVLKLLRENPFPDGPPRYVRARLSLYRFTKGGSPDWWAIDDVGEYCPPMALKSRAAGDD